MLIYSILHLVASSEKKNFYLEFGNNKEINRGSSSIHNRLTMDIHFSKTLKSWYTFSNTVLKKESSLIFLRSCKKNNTEISYLSLLIGFWLFQKYFRAS